MARHPSVIFLSTYPPQECGIATFTQHLLRSLSSGGKAYDARVAALMRRGDVCRHGRDVVHCIDNNVPGEYLRAAEFVNQGDVDIVSIQHEYGLFSGEWGSDILDFLSACRRPAVATLHTVLPEPNGPQREIIQEMSRRCERLVVMAHTGIDLLESRFGVPRDRVVMIPHGVPDVPRVAPTDARRALGLPERRMILTFGLLSRGKGIEHMIDAMPAILERHDDVVYVVLGETHPNIVRIEGESYREELVERARDLGVEGHVRFVNRFLNDDALLPWLQSADVYVTPYLGRDQITSGTLSYAVAAGCAVVSTPYIYARELLADDRGRLADFMSGASLAGQINALLGDAPLWRRLRQRAHAYGRAMTWRTVGRSYRDLFARVVAGASESRRRPQSFAVPMTPIPPTQRGADAPHHPHTQGA